jgi:hypothetical protein
MTATSPATRGRGARTGTVGPELAARRIYRAIFGEEPPRTVIVRFVPAFERLCARAPRGEVDALFKAIGSTRNLGALEVAARYRGRLTLLVAAFRLMVYVAEAEPANQDRLVKRSRDVPGAIAALLLGAFRTAFDLLVGLILLLRVHRG